MLETPELNKGKPLTKAFWFHEHYNHLQGIGYIFYCICSWFRVTVIRLMTSCERQIVEVECYNKHFYL